MKWFNIMAKSVKKNVTKFRTNKSKTMFNAAAEMDKLEDTISEAHADHKGKTLNEILIIAKPIIEVASNLFFIPRKAREILKTLLLLISAMEKEQG